MLWKKEQVVDATAVNACRRGKRFAKRFLALALAGSMLMGGVFSAQAATLRDIFDAKSYAETYSDLKAAFGTNEKALFKHYVTYGLKENRTMNELIDVKKYREAYADLNTAFGDNWDAYVNHYLIFGAKEGRNSFGTFDAVAYADRYADLKAAFGYDILALWKHYVKYGKSEGRIATAVVTSVNEESSDVETNNNNQQTTPDTDNNTNNNTDNNTNNGTITFSGRLVNPETGEPISNAVIQVSPVGAFVPAGFTASATLTVESFVTTMTAVLAATVSGGDVSGNNPQLPNVNPEDPFTVVTDENGNYSFYNLPEGTYTATVSAAGYITLTLDTIIVNDGQASVAPVISLLSESADGESKIAGRLTNAIDGTGIEGVTVELRSNWNNYDGEVVYTVTTDANGEYVIDAARGYYTATFTKDGFVSKSQNVLSVANYTTNVQHEALTPSVAADSYRVVLTWGETPRDLDSHITGPATNGEAFHVYFGNREYSVNGEAVVTLDHDDVTSYGPETVTIITPEDNAIYRYSVHNWSGESNMAETSSATVVVYAGANQVATYYIPTTGDGRMWNVFEIRDGQLYTLNTFANSDDSYYADALYTE